MNFSVTVPQEWLLRRRNQVAEASRKIRAKKKQEEAELREENQKLREERAAMLQKITDLETSISSLSERDADLENELLRTQLDQHKGFLRGFLNTIVSLEPSETSSKGELSKQNKDFALMHAFKMINDSQRDVQGKEWHSVEIPEGFVLPGKTDYSILYSRPESGTLHIRCDLVLPRFKAVEVRDLFSKYWHDKGVFQSVFGQHNMMNTVELGDFSVDDSEKEETLRAYWCREPVGAKYQDTVFLAALGATVLSKSTLQLPPGRGPVLSQSFPLQEYGSANSDRESGGIKGSKRAKTLISPLHLPSDPVDWGICGTAKVYYALRTVTGHGLDLDHDDEKIERMMSTGVEVMLHWDEEIESIDPEIAGPCTRFIHLLSLPSDFKFQAVGNAYDFVDANGKAGLKYTEAMKNMVGLIQIMLNRIPSTS